MVGQLFPWLTPKSHCPKVISSREVSVPTKDPLAPWKLYTLAASILETQEENGREFSLFPELTFTNSPGPAFSFWLQLSKLCKKLNAQMFSL